jgi:hypothetical protein
LKAFSASCSVVSCLDIVGFNLLSFETLGCVLGDGGQELGGIEIGDLGELSFLAAMVLISPSDIAPIVLNSFIPYVPSLILLNYMVYYPWRQFHLLLGKILCISSMNSSSKSVSLFDSRTTFILVDLMCGLGISFYLLYDYTNQPLRNYRIQPEWCILTESLQHGMGFA